MGFVHDVMLCTGYISTKVKHELQEGLCWCLHVTLVTLERKIMISVTSKSELKFLSMSFVFSFFFFPGLLYLE